MQNDATVRALLAHLCRSHKYLQRTHWLHFISRTQTIVSLQSLKAPELKDRLEESEKLIQEMTISWEEKLRKTEEIAQVIEFGFN